MHDRGPEGVRAGKSLGRPITTGLLGHSVMIENSPLQQRRPALCRERGFGVATEAWVLRQSFGQLSLVCVATVGG